MSSPPLLHYCFGPKEGWEIKLQEMFRITDTCKSNRAKPGVKECQYSDSKKFFVIVSLVSVCELTQAGHLKTLHIQTLN